MLILGETGTGKELVARAIHENSPRAGRAFVAVNCGALPDTLLESELFGHVRGAFTGADRDKRGLFEEAEGGTLLLDEVGDTSPAFQTKLLRALEAREIRPVGGTDVRHVDVRVVSATHRDLAEMVDEGSFRQDLLYRLNTATLFVPSLRRRRVDIPFLAQHFAEEFGDEHARKDHPRRIVSPRTWRARSFRETCANCATRWSGQSRSPPRARWSVRGCAATMRPSGKTRPAVKAH